MKLLLAFAIVCAMAVVIQAQTEDNDWKEYKKKHGKDYKDTTDGGKEDKIRKTRFLARDAKIKKHNRGNPTYLQAHNRFSDMSDDELVKHLGVKGAPPTSSRFLRPTKNVQLEDRAIPTSLDYRNNTCLSAVRDQGSCGSCWAFSSIAALEFSYCKKYGKTLSMSEQHLVDCDTINGGCNGGWYTSAWDYLKTAGGSAKQSLYSYTGVEAATCKYTASMLAVKVSSNGYASLTKNITAIQSALVTYGPLSIAINVVDSFYSYSSGVYTDTACDGTSVNHAVVLVGWGALNGVNYWIVRNSWGDWWGLAGYVLIQRGVNKCNIEAYPAYVVAA